MSALSPLGAAAIEYAKIGWPIFPCVPRGKNPLADAAPHGFKDATTDLDKIHRWWRHWPDANVAVACGSPGPDVLDIDTKDGRSGQDLYRRAWRFGLARGHSAAIRTPSGGRHFWFAGTGQRGSAVGRDKALELKATGGYVLLPPSYVVSEEYGYAGHYEVIEHSDREAVVDFVAIKRLLDPPPEPQRPARPRPRNGAILPGDAFNQSVSWGEFLLPRGWTFASQRAHAGCWCRPGKSDRSISATTNYLRTDRLHVFTTGVVNLEPGSYSKFGVLATQDFGKDFDAAARYLRTLGYGTAPRTLVAA